MNDKKLCVNYRALSDNEFLQLINNGFVVLGSTNLPSELVKKHLHNLNHYFNHSDDKEHYNLNYSNDKKTSIEECEGEFFGFEFGKEKRGKNEKN